MKILAFVILFLPAFASSQSPLNNKALKLANNANSTFDPFIDYGEFQNNVTETEDIDFFQNGRSLNIALLGGYEALSLNMRQIYGDSLIFGASLGYFVDLRFALQLRGVFPSGHYNSLFNTTSAFLHVGLDIKYYLNRQYLSKNVDFFNPYFIIGPFWSNIKSQIPQIPDATATPDQAATSLERQAAQSWPSIGIKLGTGLEIPLVKQSFIGLEISYLYTVLEHENQDLSQLNLPPARYNPNQNLMNRLLYPNRPQTTGFRFFGDLINFVFLLGVNF